jgi:hypothetical protein
MNKGQKLTNRYELISLSVYHPQVEGWKPILKSNIIGYPDIPL